MLTFRLATADDVNLYFNWANDPEVRKNSFNQEKVKLSDHQKWFTKRLEDSSTHLLIFLDNEVPIGQLRLEVEDHQGLINFSIAKNSRGKGYSTELLRLTVAYFFEKDLGHTVKGYVKLENIPSQKAFERAGFKSESNSDSILFSVRK